MARQNFYRMESQLMTSNFLLLGISMLCAVSGQTPMVGGNGFKRFRMRSKPKLSWCSCGRCWQCDDGKTVGYGPTFRDAYWQYSLWRPAAR